MKSIADLKENIIVEEKRELRYLRFSQLEKLGFVRHGFILGKEDGPKIDSLQIPGMISDIVGIPEKKFSVVIPRQVHQAQVLCFKEKMQEKVVRMEGDALVTDRENLFLVIQVADCLPVFLVDPKTEIVGLAHVGWRGAVLRIAEQVMRKSNEVFNARPAELKIIFGPSIGKCCCEISDDLAVLFNEKYLDKRGADYYLNLSDFVKDKFLKSGAKEENIFSFGECTFCSDEKYQSFRRDKDKAGRMIAFVGKVAERPD